jgi:DNA-binding NtrC family response regulator
MQKLIKMPWHGNVRELENVVERAVVLARGNYIEIEDLPKTEDISMETFFGNATADMPAIEDLEKRYIKLVLDKVGGRKDKAAQILGINRRTLYRKERDYGFVTADDTCENDVDFLDNRELTI